MKAFLKTLLGGAAGLGALYVVGKICFNIGKEVAEVERQLESQKNEVEHYDWKAHAGRKPEPDSEENRTEVKSDTTPDTTIQETKSGLTDKIRNAKAFIRIKKAFEGNRSPGVLGSLLRNPEGAKIEAFVQNGGVRINVSPGEKK